MLGLGILVPLVLHFSQLASQRESRQVDTLAALSSLVGGFLLRAVFVFGGRQSGLLPRDYFQMTQPVRYGRRIP